MANSMLECLRERIVQDGALRFDHYWEIVLYEPGLGYYAGGMEKFGADGDFVTAPGLGRLFGRCLARQLGGLLAACEEPAVLLELGAGDGTLAAQILQQLDDDGTLCDEYWILDRSGELRARQQATLSSLPSHLHERIQWLDTEPRSDWNGVLFGNEVVDALAPRRFQFRQNEWMEAYVDWQDNSLEWSYKEAPPEFVAELNRKNPVPAPGTLVEIQTTLEPWLAGLTHYLTRGATVLIDYGYPDREYFAAERTMGTLICHDRHRAHDDPLRNPGSIDISVSVNFTALAHAMDTSGITPVAYLSQAAFLMANGLGDLLHELPNLDPEAQLTMANEVKRLTLPAEMGERFQVLMGLKSSTTDTTDLQHLAPHNRIDRL